MVDIIVGGQYGSEGKGVVAKAIAMDYDVHIRVGGPNAGHSFVHNGKLYKMQSVPCGWVNPKAHLAIGPGGVVSLQQVEKELNATKEFGTRDRFFIDPNATIIMPHHDEGHTSGEIHQRIGSTGEGIGAARMDRFRRDEATGFQTAHAYSRRPDALLAGRPLASYLSRTSTVRRLGSKALIEGTQGFGLSITHGEWPYVTTSDPTAGAIAAECGVGPKDLDKIFAVFRSMPIRVAGNSGPMFAETTWEEVSQRLGRDVIEKTTVTKKVRRIGGWDWNMFSRSIEANTPTHLILTFADYLDKADHNVTEWDKLSETTQNHVKMMERLSGVPVIMIGTGFSEETGWVFVDRRK